MKRLWLLVLIITLVGCGSITNATQDDDGDDDGEVALADESAYDDRSPWDYAQPRGTRLAVAAANWSDPIGSIAAIDLSDFSVTQALLTTDGSDVIVRTFGGRIYVVNRFGTDTVQVIDSSDFSVVANYSVGGGSNPQDIWVRSDAKAYVTRLDAQNDAENTDDVLIINPITGAVTGSIDLTLYAANDGDQLARAAQMVGVDTELYVLIQDLSSSFSPADQPGKIVVIDMTTDEVIGAITLDGRNPSDITYSPVTEKIYVVNTGVFVNFPVTDVNDAFGGIEVVEPETMQTEGIAIDDADFGNYLMNIVIGEDRAYTVVNGMTLASFDIDALVVTAANLYTSPGFFIPDFTVDEDGQVLVTEHDVNDAGIVVLDGANGNTIAGPLGVGALPAAVSLY